MVAAEDQTGQPYDIIGLNNAVNMSDLLAVANFDFDASIGNKALKHLLVLLIVCVIC